VRRIRPIIVQQIGGAVAVVIVAIPIAARRHKSFEQHYPCRTTQQIKPAANGSISDRPNAEPSNILIAPKRKQRSFLLEQRTWEQGNKRTREKVLLD
jgi:hypothetical protein